MIMKIAFATNNAKKAKEVQDILGFPIDILALELPEIQSLNVEEVAFNKAQKAYEASRVPVFVDDTGLFVDAWAGFPGPLVKHLLESVGLEGILKMLEGFENRKASAKGVIAYCDGEGTKVFTGVVEGSIAESPRGSKWGWDPIFVPLGQDKTYAEMTLEEKNSISHRRKSLDEFLKFLSF